MSSSDTEVIGKPVKDMYGASMGRVVGTITDIDGSIQTVGVDCGPGGLRQVPFDQLVVQGSVVIFVPKWRLESQRLLREKGLTLRRLEALSAIVSENDEMREDASVINDKYRAKLEAFEGAEREIQGQLEGRLGELGEQMALVKTMAFDARVQFKSNEIPEHVFESVRTNTSSMIEHITHETAEISSVQRRIADLGMRARQALEEPERRLQDSAVTYLGARAEAKLPEAPTQAPIPEPPEHAPAPRAAAPFEGAPEGAQDGQGGQPAAAPEWLARMQAQ